MQNKGWYEKDGWIIALLILFFPIGFLLMWKSKWNKNIKIAITLIFGLIVIIGAITSNQQPKTDEKNGQQIVETTSIKTPSPTLQPGAITLNSLAPYIVDFNPTYNNDRYIGFANKGKDNVTLVGTKDNITQIRYEFNQVDNDSIYNPTTIITLISRLTHQVIPQWTDSDKWIKNSFESFSNSSDDAPSNEITEGNKKVKLFFSKSTNDLGFEIIVNK